MSEQIPQVVSFLDHTASEQSVLFSLIGQNLPPSDNPVSYDWVIENLTSEQIDQIIQLVDTE
jgi:hypothetical protein